MFSIFYTFGRIISVSNLASVCVCVRASSTSFDADIISKHIRAQGHTYGHTEAGKVTRERASSFYVDLLAS